LNILNPEKTKAHAGILVAFLFLSLFQGCAVVPVKPPGPPFGYQEIDRIIANLREQQERVHTSFSSGSLTLRCNGSKYDANVLIVGTKNPFKVKIEIAHPWGRPLLHILILDATLHILSFTEKEYFLGRIDIPGPSKFLPISLAHDHLWTLVRTYPILCEHKLAVSYKANRITLLNGKDKTVQVIHFCPQTNHPSTVSFPEHDIEISFDDFQIINGIRHAEKIRLEDHGTKTILKLDLKQTAFNETIPAAIFEMTIPSGFKMLSLPCTSP
jgi:hypothetical protein